MMIVIKALAFRLSEEMDHIVLVGVVPIEKAWRTLEISGFKRQDEVGASVQLFR